MEESELSNPTSKSLKPLLFQFLLLNPLPDEKSQSTVAATKEHVSWRPLSSKIGGKDIRYVCESWEEAAFAVEIVRAVKLKRFIVFEDIDKDEWGSDKDEFVRCHVPYMQYRLIEWFFTLDYLIFCCAVVHSEPETDWIVVTDTLLIAVVVVVTHPHVVLKHVKTDYCLIS